MAGIKEGIRKMAWADEMNNVSMAGGSAIGDQPRYDSFLGMKNQNQTNLMFQSEMTEKDRDQLHEECEFDKVIPTLEDKVSQPVIYGQVEISSLGSPLSL